jgi:hypothetical protein
MTAQTNGMLRSLGKHERDDTVRFWAERDPAVYWRSLMISSLIASPIAFIAPEAFIVGTGLGAVVAWLNKRLFRLEMTPTHVRLKASSLMPSLYLPYAAIADARAEQKDPAQPGALIFKLATGHELRLSGIVQADEAAQAFRTLKAARTDPSWPTWPNREAA